MSLKGFGGRVAAENKDPGTVMRLLSVVEARACGGGMDFPPKRNGVTQK